MKATILAWAATHMPSVPLALLDTTEPIRWRSVSHKIPFTVNLPGYASGCHEMVAFPDLKVLDEDLVAAGYAVWEYVGGTGDLMTEETFRVAILPENSAARGRLVELFERHHARQDAAPDEGKKEYIAFAGHAWGTGDRVLSAITAAAIRGGRMDEGAPFNVHRIADWEAFRSRGGVDSLGRAYGVTEATERTGRVTLVTRFEEDAQLQERELVTLSVVYDYDDDDDDVGGE